MDVDLSTDLRALLPLIAPLIWGHSDLDSRVDVLATVREDLAGIVRLAKGFARVDDRARGAAGPGRPADPVRRGRRAEHMRVPGPLSRAAQGTGPQLANLGAAPATLVRVLSLRQLMGRHRTRE